jgi:hypothetical protein
MEQTQSLNVLIGKKFGRGGGDRKLNLLSQVLNCQRRSTAALLPIGVKWCQDQVGFFFNVPFPLKLHIRALFESELPMAQSVGVFLFLHKLTPMVFTWVFNHGFY